VLATTQRRQLSGLMVGVLAFLMSYNPAPVVSIHAPRVERDARPAKPETQIVVSIHAPRVERDDVGNGVDRWLSVSRLAHSNSINSTPCGMGRSILIS
jgi:hypothetical protein